jgi:N-acyl homoserine lactone hydrolase
VTDARALKLWPLLTGTQRYEKVVSTRDRGHGLFIDAPILAYLIESPNGRILYDVGCDYSKIANLSLRSRYFEPMRPTFEPPQMQEEQRIPRYLAKLSLTPADVDVVFLGHLHFDHAGGLCDLQGCEVHVHRDELKAAATGEYQVDAGIHAIASPGHTAGHMSLLIELPSGPPVILCGDAADLTENLVDEVAPGYCWEDNTELAVSSIRKLKALALREKAELWPNHDFEAYRRWPQFPAWR